MHEINAAKARYNELRGLLIESDRDDDPRYIAWGVEAMALREQLQPRVMEELSRRLDVLQGHCEDSDSFETIRGLVHECETIERQLAELAAAS